MGLWANTNNSNSSILYFDLGQSIWMCLMGKIEDRGVNSLSDCKEIYNGSIILLQERGDIQAQISPLFNAGF